MQSFILLVLLERTSSFLGFWPFLSKAPVSRLRQPPNHILCHPTRASNRRDRSFLANHLQHCNRSSSREYQIQYSIVVTHPDLRGCHIAFLANWLATRILSYTFWGTNGSHCAILLLNPLLHRIECHHLQNSILTTKCYQMHYIYNFFNKHTK